MDQSTLDLSWQQSQIEGDDDSDDGKSLEEVKREYEEGAAFDAQQELAFSTTMVYPGVVHLPCPICSRYIPKAGICPDCGYVG